MEELLIFLKDMTIQIAIVLAIVLLGSWVIGILESKSDKDYMESFGFTAIVLTGLGTVIHELSHLIMCLIGFMKPKEVKLFRPIKGRQDGKLGYVSYSYNRKSIYQNMFLVLVGIAPIIGGTIVSVLCMKFLVPTMFESVAAAVTAFDFTLSSSVFVEVFEVIKSSLSALIDSIDASRFSFWIFLFLIISVSSHMSMSTADVKGVVRGIPGFFLFYLLVVFIAKAFGVDNTAILAIFTSINGIIVSFLSIAIFFSIVNCIIAFGLKTLVKVVKR